MIPFAENFPFQKVRYFIFHDKNIMDANSIEDLNFSLLRHQKLDNDETFKYLKSVLEVYYKKRNEKYSNGVKD